jgi:hypothetical protein
MRLEARLSIRDRPECSIGELLELQGRIRDMTEE